MTDMENKTADALHSAGLGLDREVKFAVSLMVRRDVNLGGDVAMRTVPAGQ
jgi:hypothetical protein